jgi:DNA-binding NarL/FixJ family response regulator
MSKIQILISDSYKLNRENLSYVLNADGRFQVMAECDVPSEAIEFVKSSSPDIILMSLNDPLVSELDATRELYSLSPSSHVIGISANPQPSFAKRMMQRGIKGVVTKNSSQDEMIKAILAVNEGKRYVCSEVRNIVADEHFSDEEDSSDVTLLTRREVEIINFIKAGLSSKLIAYKLGISLRTIQAHRYNILRKLKLKNAAALVNFINTKGSHIN